MLELRDARTIYIHLLNSIFSFSLTDFLLLTFSNVDYNQEVNVFWFV